MSVTNDRTASASLSLSLSLPLSLSLLQQIAFLASASVVGVVSAGFSLLQVFRGAVTWPEERQRFTSKSKRIFDLTL